ncbi:hypothetical protein RclHR1_05020010 [Rhizophagus clarus]|uniref:HMG (High mobility group) box domain-containing protein n=1 Tax=Rhizophagus clarus TaxID=94130 RepID=A0A2Z6RQR0_9GLOM|nr:hypothetical protein RclHR1_05020010 [Rhizophagus clarus]GET04293.1 HMG (high mobility group) box domain-containing protein [Rhizophagus clarus]
MSKIYNINSIELFDSDSQVDPEILLQLLLSQTPPPYQLTLPLDDLVNSPPKSNGTIPRPKNSFIIFRNDYSARIKTQSSNMTVAKISRIVSQAWKNQPASVLQFFEILSMVSYQRHRNMYPNYKYAPQKKEKNPQITQSSLILVSDEIEPPKNISYAADLSYDMFSTFDDENTILIDKMLGIFYDKIHL